MSYNECFVFSIYELSKLNVVWNLKRLQEISIEGDEKINLI